MAAAPCGVWTLFCAAVRRLTPLLTGRSALAALHGITSPVIVARAGRATLTR